MSALHSHISTLQKTLSSENTHFQTFECTVSIVTSANKAHIHRSISRAITRVHELSTTLHTNEPKFLTMPGGWEDETNKLKALQELADNVGDAFEDAAAAADEALKYIMGFVKEGVEFQAARIVPVPVQLVAVAECAWARTGDGDAAGEDEGGKRECGVFVGVKGRGLDAVKKEERETMGLLKKEEIETVERARVWLREQAADKGASGKAIGWMVGLGLIGVAIAPQIVVPIAAGMLDGMAYGVEAHKEADALDRQAVALKQSWQTLESEVSKLDWRVSKLNAQQSRLLDECIEYRVEVFSLQDNLSSLKVTLVENPSLETSIKGIFDRPIRLSEETSSIQNQLRQMKADTAVCTQLLRESHNETSFMKHFEYDCELAYNTTRQQLIESVGEIVEMLKTSDPAIMGQ